MIIGLPKEIKNNEFRVGLTPGAVGAYVQAGNTVLVEQGAGLGSGFTDQEYVEALGRLAAGRPLREIVVDPSAASFITALRQAGYRVRKADNDVLYGIRVTADLLKQGRVVICEGCRDCLREMALYRWSEDGGGRDSPRKEEDHAMDDMRYFCVSVAGSGSAAEAAFCSVVRG